MTAIAYVKHKQAPIHAANNVSWKSITAGLSKVAVGEKEGDGWLPADIERGPRTGDRVKSVSLLVLDIEAHAEAVHDESGNVVRDHNGDIVKRLIGADPPDFDGMRSELSLWGWRYILHTSYSHLEQHPRYRLVIDLSRPLVASAKGDHEVKALGKHVAEIMGLSECLDNSALDPARLFYRPRVPADRTNLFRHADAAGSPLDVDALLAEARRAEQAGIAAQFVKRGGKTGNVIEAFNAAHDVGAILDAHGYKRKGRNRWLYPESTTGTPGVRLLPDRIGKQMIYSSHSGDPLNDGHAHDAFDLWRILVHGGDVRNAIKDAAQIVGLSNRLEAPMVDISEWAELTPRADENNVTAAGSCPLEPYPEPFRGVMADVVEAALAVSTKSQPALCTLAAVLGMSASCSGAYSLPSGMRLNLFGCGVAGTGEGKELPRSIATALAKAAGGNTIGKPASGPGLEDHLTDNTGMLLAIDEIAHFFAAINGQKAPPHLIELAGTMLQLFSASRGDYSTRVKAVARGAIPPRTISNPMVNILGFATPEKLGEAMGISSIEDGLLGRFLFAFGQTGVVPRRITTSFVLPESVVEAAKKVGEAAEWGAMFTPLADNNDTAVPSDSSLPILIDPDADVRLAELQIEFDQKRGDAQSAFAKALLTRSSEKCERVAGVLAVWDNPKKPVITMEHVAWAEKFLRASDSALLFFCGEYMHGGETQANAQRVKKLIGRVLDGDFKAQKRHESELLNQKVAPYSMLMRASKLAKRQFDDAVEHLVGLSDVVNIILNKTHPNGRPEQIRGLCLHG